MNHDQIRRLLTVMNRSHQHMPGKQLLGPTGARLWMDYLEMEPGFSGRADFIHKINLPLLFSTAVDGRTLRLVPAKARWTPDETRLHYEDDRLVLDERKTITWDDCAVCVQHWENRSSRPMTLSLLLPEGAEEGRVHAFQPGAHGVAPVMLCRSQGFGADGSLTVAPGGKATVLIAAAVEQQGGEDLLLPRLEALLDGRDPEALLDDLCERYMAWFDDVPSFACSDPMITACWYYRFYILRKNLACPGVGRLPGRTFYEGRSHRAHKQPGGLTTGWEFSRLIPLSTPMHVQDLRWMRDLSLGADALRALTFAADGNGVFAVTSIDKSELEYANYSAWALYLWYQCSGDLTTVRSLLPAFKADAKGVFRVTGCEADALQIETTHARTGKEYQPSYWFFGEDCFPPKVRPAKVGYTPLKRVDRSIYSYLNFTGLARLCELAGDGDAAWFEEKAQQMRRDILGKMWDESTGFFYDLHHETDEKALVKNIVGYYPFWAGITQEKHLRAFDYLFSPAYFSLGSGYASAAKDCPVFSANGGWRGDYFKGRNGCMWNGPSWPYTTGVVLDALARQSKEGTHAYDAEFTRGLQEYTMEHFRGGNVEDPFLVEFYDSVTGEPLSNEVDYNHSYYIDLIVRHAAGVEPDDEGVCFHPVDAGLRTMELRDVRIRGRRIDVALADGVYTVQVDGETVYQGAGRETVRILRWNQKD